MKAIFRGLAAVALVAMAAKAPAASAAPTNKQLTIGITQEFENLNPIISSMMASKYIYYIAGRQLVAIDSDWKWYCVLCTTMPTVENGLAKVVDEKGAKKMLVNWEIKANANWGDGKPVTGHDVKLSWEIGASKNVTVGEKDLYERIESVDVDAKNPKKFTIKLKEPRYDYNQIGTFYLVPAHLEGAIFAKTKDQVGAYEKLTKYTTEPTNPGLYNGPYVVKEIKLGSHVTLEPNASFYGNKPAIQRIVVKLIPNTQTLEANLLSGTIDMVSELGMSFDQQLAFEKRVKADANLKAKYLPVFEDGMVYEHIDLNLDNPLLADLKVRKALVHAIDRDKLSQALFEGRQKKAISMIHPKDVYYTTDVAQYDFNVEKAQKLLADAGFKKGSSGFLEKDGKKLTLSIMTTAQNKTRELVEVFIQEQLKKIGIEVTINNEPARVFFGETTSKRRFPGMAMYAWVSSPDNPPRSTLHSENIPTEKNGWSGQNYPGWKSARADELFVQIQGEFDVAKRKAMMVEIQKLYTEEVPVIPLYMRADLSVVPTNLKGYKITGHQFSSTLAVENWNLDGAATQGH